MGIFTSILSLLSCGHGNKRVTQNDGINSNIPVAARITIDKLPDVLRNVQAGNTDYDFIGICSNGVDCIYFVLENGKFYIDFEAMGKEQLPYIDTLKQFAKEHNYPIVETTYNNTPVDYEHLKYAPVLSLKVNADIDSIVKVGSQIEQTIFRNNERTVYEMLHKGEPIGIVAVLQKAFSNTFKFNMEMSTCDLSLCQHVTKAVTRKIETYFKEHPDDEIKFETSQLPVPPSVTAIHLNIDDAQRNHISSLLNIELPHLTYPKVKEILSDNGLTEVLPGADNTLLFLFGYSWEQDKNFNMIYFRYDFKRK